MSSPQPTTSIPATADPSVGDVPTLDPNALTVPQTDGSATDLPPGYDKLGILGRGGNGVVYLARQRQADRIVALKMIVAGPHATPTDLARFRTEAIATAKLNHPNVVPVYEVGTHGELPYFTLEYLPGGSLEAASKEPWTAKDAARLVEAIARGVAHAHAHGIIHRDLKPANVLLRKDEGERMKDESKPGPSDSSFFLHPSSFQPKVTDFGLARRLDADTGVTHTNQVMGTPSYMAPEQARGETAQAGAPADVYALGAILYRLVTGRPPFVAANIFLIVKQVQTDDPPAPSSLVPDLPRDVETIILKALSKDAAKRYATADELADDLRRWQTGEPIRARPVGAVERAWKWTKRHRGLVGGTAMVIAALAIGAGVAGWQWWRALSAEGKAQQALSDLTVQQNHTHLALVAETEAKDKTVAALASAETAKQTALEALRKLTAQLVVDRASRQTSLTPQDQAFLADIRKSWEAFATTRGESEEALMLAAEGAMNVALIRHQLKDMNGAETDYGVAIERYSRLATEHPAELRHHVGLSLSRLGFGQLLFTRGRLSDAERELASASAIAVKLLLAQPNNLTLLSHAARLRMEYGTLYLKTGRPVRAVEEMVAARDLFARIGRSDPTEGTHRESLAFVHSNLAVAYLQTGQLPNSVAEATAARNLWQQMLTERANDPFVRHKISVAELNLGYGLRVMERLPEAEASFSKAVVMAIPLAAEYPGQAEYAMLLATTRSSLAVVLTATGRYPLAAEQLIAARDVLDRLVRDYPMRPEYEASLGRTRTNLGIAYRYLNRWSEAEAEYQAARRQYAALAASQPTVPEHRHMLASVLIDLARLRRQSRQFAEARRLLEEAVPHHRAALAAEPSNPPFKHFMCDNRYVLVEVLLDQGEYEIVPSVIEEMMRYTIHPASDSESATAFLVQCIPQVKDDVTRSAAERTALAVRYAETAIVYLRQAVELGGTTTSDIRKNSNLLPLRSRASYHLLLARTEHRNLEPTPPPRAGR